MLVLTRKLGESICIGSDIEVVVLDVVRGRVKLGFAGPRNVPIRRGELRSPDAPTETEPELIVNESPDVHDSHSRPAATIPGCAPLRNLRVVAGIS